MVATVMKKAPPGCCFGVSVPYLARIDCILANVSDNIAGNRLKEEKNENPFSAVFSYGPDVEYHGLCAPFFQQFLVYG
jgi:hypothetical protein